MAKRKTKPKKVPRDPGVGMNKKGDVKRTISRLKKKGAAGHA